MFPGDPSRIFPEEISLEVPPGIRSGIPAEVPKGITSVVSGICKDVSSEISPGFLQRILQMTSKISPGKFKNSPRSFKIPSETFPIGFRDSSSPGVPYRISTEAPSRIS